jgi:hypothetical protein
VVDVPSVPVCAGAVVDVPVPICVGAEDDVTTVPFWQSGAGHVSSALNLGGKWDLPGIATNEIGVQFGGYAGFVGPSNST